MQNVILQSLGLDLFNINVYTKVYQNIPNGLRVLDIFSELSWTLQTEMELYLLVRYTPMIDSVISCLV